MQTSGNLSSFYLAAAEDAAFWKLFRTDPEAAMSAAGLSEREKGIVRRGDRDEIRAALSASLLYSSPSKGLEICEAIAPTVRAPTLDEGPR
jgi:hypothetical protein